MPTRKKPHKTLRPRLKPPKGRVSLEPKLTASEVKKLRARAAANMRSIAGYVAFLIIQHLSGRGNGRKRRETAANPRDKRVSYAVSVMLRLEHREKLEDRAEADGRSVSSFVARLIVEDLATR